MNGLVRTITGLLKKEKTAGEPGNDQTNKSLMKVLVQAPKIEDREMANIYESTFSSLFTTTGLIMSGRLELLLYPGRVVCALYHYRLDSSPMAVPIGIISSSPEHLSSAAELLANLCRGHDVYKLDHRGGRSIAVHGDLDLVPEIQVIAPTKEQEGGN